MKICQISDLHWRGISRHKEYTQAFEQLFVQLRELNPDIIVNCGDTFHTKTMGITPEIIERLSWMFRSLADIAPSYTILGNHDGNLTNLHRQDTITPIHEAIRHPKAHLLRKSGVYKVEEIVEKDVYLAAFSPFDKKAWANIKPVVKQDGTQNEVVNIALYHGSVENATTDTNWRIDAEHAEDKVSLFDGFDYIFLGDVHKQQFVSHRTVELEVDEQALAKYIAEYGENAIEIIG